MVDNDQVNSVNFTEQLHYSTRAKLASLDEASSLGQGEGSCTSHCLLPALLTVSHLPPVCSLKTARSNMAFNSVDEEPGIGPHCHKRELLPKASHQMSSLCLYASLPPPSRLLVRYKQPCFCHLVNQGMDRITCFTPDAKHPALNFSMACKFLLDWPNHLHFTPPCLWNAIVTDVKQGSMLHVLLVDQGGAALDSPPRPIG